MLKIELNNRVLDLNLNPELDGGELDGQEFSVDVLQKNQIFHVIKDHKGYKVEVVSIDRQKKTVELKVNGHLIQTKIKDQFDALLASMGMEIGAKKKAKDLKAPMPGLVLDIQVAVGDEVQEKEPILILEAMKMENVIKSPSDGVIKNIIVSKGSTVEKDEVLLEFE